MENLNAEQIKKALECCRYGGRCAECPCFEIPNCQALANENALALITSQEQRIKELTEENERLRAELTEANKDKRILFDEIASLEAEAEKAIDIAEGNIRAEIASGGTSCHWCEDKVRADTVRQMQKMLKNCLYDKPSLFTQQRYIVVDVIDQIAKEMLEGEK